MDTLQKYEKYFYLFILLGIIIYFPTFFNGFVWDDKLFIINDPGVHQINIPYLFSHNLFNSDSFYRPIAALYYATLYSLSGPHAFPYHLLQLLLHISITSLLFIYFLTFFKKRISLFLALIFLVHPINFESVGYIDGALSELYFLPGIIALLISRKKTLSRNEFILTTILLLISLFGKETGFLFLVLIITYRYFFKLGQLRKFLLSGISVLFIYIPLRFFIAHATFQPPATYLSISTLSFPQRLLNIPAILFYYIKIFVFPNTLTIYQTWIVKQITFQNFFFPLEVCILLLASALYFIYTIAKKDNRSSSDPLKNKNQNDYVPEKPVLLKQFAFFAIWYLIGMGLISQIKPLDMTVADRWFYFPIVGVLGMIGVAFEYNYTSIKQHYKMYLSLAIIIIILFSLRTFMRAFDFKYDITIFADAKHQSGNEILDYDYALALYTAGKNDEALKYANRSIATFPTIMNKTLLGNIYQDLNQCDKAIPVLQQAETYYKESTQSSPGKGFISLEDYTLNHTYNVLAYCYIDTNQPQEAIDLLKNKALKKFPNDVQFYINLANSYLAEGDKDQTITELSKAYTLDPSPSIKNIYNNFKNNFPVIQPDNSSGSNYEIY